MAQAHDISIVVVPSMRLLQLCTRAETERLNKITVRTVII
jgi:hypothetical protein